MNNKVFITCGLGSYIYVLSGKRLIHQVNNTGYFNESYLIRLDDLKNDKQFWERHSKFILNNKLGFGYWLWKSYIIKKQMEKMNDGDIIMYLDSGCEIKGSKKKLIPQFFDYVKEDKIITSNTCKDKCWTKMDLIKHFNMENNILLDKPQKAAGAILIYVCKETRDIINLWYETSSIYNLIDDSPSVSKNDDCFKNHRHDQSILSLLLKKNNILSKRNLKECIYYNRNKNFIYNIFYLLYYNEYIIFNFYLLFLLIVFFFIYFYFFLFIFNQRIVYITNKSNKK